MSETRQTIFIDNDLGRHAPEFEQIHLLTEELEHTMGGIGETYEWQIVFLPVGFERKSVLWTNDDDFSVEVDKPGIVLAQLRHMRLAEWSGKTPVENQEDMFLIPKIGKLEMLTVEIGKGEIWCWKVDLDCWHSLSHYSG